MPASANSGTVVIDNGAGTLKFGFAGEAEPRKVMPSAIVTGSLKRRYVGDEVSGCKNFANLHYQQPCDRGYVVDWTALQALWERGMAKGGLGVSPKDSTLLVTEPPCCPPAIQKSMDQFVFECMGFSGYYSTRPARMASFALSPSPAHLVVDCGFSFSHATPVFDHFDLNHATKRVSIGGKVLTNQLKEVVSYRVMNMMNETHLINQIKEQLGYIALDFDAELKKSVGRKSQVAREYVLPDYQTIMVGHVKEQEDGGAEPPAKKPKNSLIGKADDDDGPTILRVNNERFTVPELLFHPSDIGLVQGGVVEACVQAVSACPTDLQPALWSNIALVGGSTQFPGFKERLETALRSRAPVDCDVVVHTPENPVTAVWRGGSILGATADFADWVVTKEEYDEFGDELCRRRFMA